MGALRLALGCASDKQPEPAAVEKCEPDATGRIGKPPAAGSCSEALPSAVGCPASAPSYKAEISTIIGMRCAPCHTPGGLAQPPFNNYFNTFIPRAEMTETVRSCVMPPSCAPQLTPDERQKLLQWLVCDAPEN